MNDDLEHEPLLTPREVAAMFRVDPKTVTRWANAGKLTSVRTLGDADPAGAAALAARCSRLPLALRVAAEFACSHPEVGLADLSAELADQQRQLDVLGV